MLSKKINAALNTQLTTEFSSSYAYLAIAGYFQRDEFEGFANFFQIQAQEEIQHGLRIFKYIHDSGGEAVLGALPAPKKDFASPAAAFEYGLHNEVQLAGEISGLLNLAIAEKHAATQVFMQWFISEQVEEEALFTRCVKLLKRAGHDGNALLLLDREFAARKAAPAPAEAE